MKKLIFAATCCAILASCNYSERPEITGCNIQDSTLSQKDKEKITLKKGDKFMFKYGSMYRTFKVMAVSKEGVHASSIEWREVDTDFLTYSELESDKGFYVIR